MPIKRKSRYTNKRRVQSNTSNRAKKNSMIPKSLRFKSDEYHTVFFSTENVNANNSIFNSNTIFTGKAITFQVTDCVNFINWEKLFDEYRLNKVVVNFTPVQASDKYRQVAVGAAPSGTVSGLTQIPFMYYLIDRNDVVPPTTRDEMKGVKGCVRKLSTEPHTVIFTPSMLVPVYQSQDPSGTINYSYTVGYQKKWNQNNLGSISKDVPYFGLKYGIENSAPEGAYNMKVSIKYYISFRKKRI